MIAHHRRSYEKADMVFDPMHYLPLLEQKVGALDQAAPLQGWDLPDEFATLHRLLEARIRVIVRIEGGKRRDRHGGFGYEVQALIRHAGGHDHPIMRARLAAA